MPQSANGLEPSPRRGLGHVNKTRYKHMRFEEAYAIGRRKAVFLWKVRQEHLLLSLKELTAIATPDSTSARGVQSIPVKSIVGTEERSNDFAQGFYPIRKQMRQRWTRIRDLMLSADGIPEAITVFEYGSAYFVRDGNHRVSVAKTHGIEFITANVISLSIPITIPPQMTRQKVPLFRAKYVFSQETPVFQHIPEEQFQVACPENWAYLKKEIFEYNKQFFINKYQRVPTDEELIRNWNFILYERTMNHIRRNALIHLFPGQSETDIFCDMIRLLNAYPDPDAQWIEEVYEAQIQKAIRQNWLRAIPMWLKRMLISYRMTEDEERALFLNHSKLLVFCPDAVLPTGDKRWYRFLRQHVLRQHVLYLKKNQERFPYLEALIPDWYETAFHPAQRFHQNNNMTIPFTEFYIGWVRSCYPQLFNAESDVTVKKLETSFQDYLRRTS